MAFTVYLILRWAMGSNRRECMACVSKWPLRNTYQYSPVQHPVLLLNVFNCLPVCSSGCFISARGWHLGYLPCALRTSPAPNSRVVARKNCSNIFQAPGCSGCSEVLPEKVIKHLPCRSPVRLRRPRISFSTIAMIQCLLLLSEAHNLKETAAPGHTSGVKVVYTPSLGLVGRLSA